MGVKNRPFQIEHAAALAAVQSYIDRCTDLAALRAKDGRVLSGENRKRIVAADALQVAFTTLEDLLAATEPKQRHDMRQLQLEYERMLATFNGVIAR